MKKNLKHPFSKKQLVFVFALVLLFALILAVTAFAEVTPAITSASLTLAEDIRMNFTVTAPADANPTMKFTYKGWELFVPPTSQDGTTYVFTFDKISPQSYEDVILGELIIDEAIVATASLSVEEYCALAVEQNANLGNLCGALLDYGAAAEWYVEEVPRNPGFLNLPIKNDMNVVAKKSLDRADGTERATMDRAGLFLTSVISTYFDFTTEEENPGFAVTVDGVEREATITNNGDGTYRATVTMKATELFGTILATVTDSEGNDISRTATYSVTAYLYQQANSENAKLSTLVRAIYNYGFYAHELGEHTLTAVSFGDSCGLACSACNEVFFVALDGERSFDTYESKGTETNSQYQKWFNLSSTDQFEIRSDLASAGAISMRISENNIGFPSGTDKNNAFAFQLVADCSAYGSGVETAEGTKYRWSNRHGSGAVFYIDKDKKMYDKAGGALGTFDGAIDLIITFRYEGDGDLLLDYYIDGRKVSEGVNVGNTVGYTGYTEVDATVVANDGDIEFGGFNAIYVSAYNNTADAGVVISNLNVIHTSGNYEYKSVLPCGALVYTEDGELREISKHHLVLETAENHFTHEANGVTITCTGCGKSYTVPAKYYGGFSNGCTQNAPLSAAPSTVNEGDALKVVIDERSTNHGDIAFTLKNCNNDPDGLFVTFDVKSGEGREGNFAVLYRTPSDEDNVNVPAANWTFSPKANLMEISPTGEIRFFGTVVSGVKVGTEEYTSVMFNLTIEQDTTDPNDVAMYVLDAWLEGQYIGQYTSEARRATGTQKLSLNGNGMLQISPRRETKKVDGVDVVKSNIMYFDHITIGGGLTDGLTHGDDLSDTFSAVHRWVDAKVTATCFSAGTLYEQCMDCGIIRETEHERLEHEIMAAGMDTLAHKHSGTKIYECVLCHEQFGVLAGYIDSYDNDCLGEVAVVNAGSVKNVGGAIYIQTNATTMLNADLSLHTKNYISSETDALLGFSLKNSSDTRDGNFVVQWKFNNDWGKSPAQNKVNVDKDGNILFGGGDTGLDLSSYRFMDFLVKIHLEEADGATTVTTELWIDTVYIGKRTETLRYTGLSLHGTQGALTYAQISTQSGKSNAMYYDNVFVADVPVAAEGESLWEYLSLEHNYELTDKVRATCMTEGEAHYSCIACGATRTDILPVKEVCDLVATVKGGQIEVRCATCGDVWNAEKSFYATSPSVKSDVSFAPGAATQNVYAKEHYNFVYKSGVDKSTQFQLFVNQNAQTGAENAARRGFASIKLKGDLGSDWTMKLCNRAAGAQWYGWTFEPAVAAIGVNVLTVDKYGSVYMTTHDDQKVGDPIAHTQDWVTLSLAFEIDAENGVLVIDYFVDGEYVATNEVENHLSGGTPFFLYLTGEMVLGADVSVDDVMFGYTDTAREDFLVHEHVYQIDDATTDLSTHSSSTHPVSGTIGYKCAGCTKAFTVEVAQANLFDDACKCGINMNANYQTVNGRLELIGAFSSGGNLDLRLGGNTALHVDSQTMVVGFDITMPEAGFPEGGVGVNVKPGEWGKTPTFTFAHDGTITFEGKTVGKVKAGEYTNVWYVCALDPENNRVVYDLYINGERVTATSVVKDHTSIGANHWGNNSNYYVVMQVSPKPVNLDDACGVILDNLFASEALPVATN